MIRTILCLAVFATLGSASLLRSNAATGRTAPDVSAEVTREAGQNLQIHDGFADLAATDVRNENEVKANKELQAFVQIDASAGKWVLALDSDMKTQMLVQESVEQPIKDPCGGITCGALNCPGGFAAMSVKGHCCPYCVNPDVKTGSGPTGATGKSGGKPSTFCPKVWCFPTMCTDTLTEPTTTNGACCPSC